MAGWDQPASVMVMVKKRVYTEFRVSVNRFVYKKISFGWHSIERCQLIKSVNRKVVVSVPYVLVCWRQGVEMKNDKTMRASQMPTNLKYA